MIFVILAVIVEVPAILSLQNANAAMVIVMAVQLVLVRINILLKTQNAPKMSF